MNALDICNSAISKVGGKILRSFDDDTPERDIVVRQYPYVRDMMLRSHTWQFAKHITVLAPISLSYYPRPWTRAFQVPADCARVLGHSAIRWERAGKVIYCTEDSLTLRYVRITETTLGATNYDSDFGECLACYLAAETAMKLTQDPGLRASYLQQYGDLLRLARFNGAIETPPSGVSATQWLEDREIGDYLDIGARDINVPAQGL
jgi:hypothetical protein